jgi:hypothetical protein
MLVEGLLQFVRNCVPAEIIRVRVASLPESVELAASLGDKLACVSLSIVAH